MKIELKQVKGKDLKAGDLFVQADQEDIDKIVDEEIGLSVYVRTNKPYQSDVYNHISIQKVKIVKNKSLK